MNELTKKERFEKLVNSVSDASSIYMPPKKWWTKKFSGLCPENKLVKYLSENRMGKHEFRVLRASKKEIVIIYQGY